MSSASTQACVEDIVLHVTGQSCEDIARKRLSSGQEENDLHEQLNPTSIVTLDFIFRPVWKQFFCLFVFLHHPIHGICYINISSLRKCMWVSQRHMSVLLSFHFAQVSECTYVCKRTHRLVHSEDTGQA